VHSSPRTRHPPPTSPPFPYTTLFRSPEEHLHEEDPLEPTRRRDLRLRRDRPRPGVYLRRGVRLPDGSRLPRGREPHAPGLDRDRSEEHTSELQSRVDLVCRLLLEKKK